MRLKAFDIDDVLYESSIYYKIGTIEEIKQKLKPYVLYFKKDDNIGICLEDQKKHIIKILSEYGKLNLKGNFTNLDTFFISDYDWDNIQLGNIEIDGQIVWKEFSKSLNRNENLFIHAGDQFEEEWFRLQKIALRKVFDIELDKIKKDIELAEKDFDKHIGIHEIK